MRRHVKVIVDHDALCHPWSVSCFDCPKKPHNDAINLPAPICTAGLMTAAQGAVPLNACDHYVRESALIEDGKVTIECRHPEAS